MSVVAIATKAVQDRYGTFTFANPLPDLWADAIPVKDSGGVAVDLPFIVVSGADGPIEYMNELDRIETARITLEVFARTKAELKSIVKGLCYNGAAPTTRAGLDDADSLTLPTGYSLNKCERITPGKVDQEKPRSDVAGLVFRATLMYDVELFVDGALAA